MSELSKEMAKMVFETHGMVHQIQGKMEGVASKNDVTKAIMNCRSSRDAKKAAEAPQPTPDPLTGSKKKLYGAIATALTVVAGILAAYYGIGS